MSDDLGRILKESGALLEGHFILTSGRHSNVYFEKFRILEQPDVLSRLCLEIAERFRSDQIDFVAGPTTGGIIIAFEVARQLGLPSRYIESENGVKTLRRQAKLPTGAKVLIVDDVLTTGLSLRESAHAIEVGGGHVVGFAVLIDRSETLDLGAPLFAAYKVQAESFAPGKVPDWLEAIPVVKPGTRSSNPAAV